ncbi:sensor domain-containing protein [Brevibacillus sp. SYSU BS000544]|uniref:sensor domain-containing protein n=1 Tax=Brevibacillus sp. SYSU BS000544 TaxID=3416443 RepID=UPI003CE57FB4
MERDANFYRLIVENLSEGLIITDQTGEIQFVNNAFTYVTGYSFEELIGRNPRLLKSGLHDKQFYEEMWSSLLVTGRWEGEIWNNRKSGELYLEYLTIWAYYNEKGKVTNYVGLLSDITIHRRIEDSLWQSNHVLKSLIEASPIGIVTLDKSRKVTMWNPAAEEIFGWKKHEIMNRQYPIIPEDQAEEFDKIFDDVINKNKKFTGLEVERITKDGFKKWVSLSTSKLVDASNNIVGFIAMFKDITENKLAEERINFLAYHDELTRLPNRRALRDTIDDAIVSSGEKDSSFAIMFIDLDQFKKVNDSLGHQYGDNLLISLSKRMSNCLRPMDDLFRIGGDEFAIFLYGVKTEEEVCDLAQQIIECVESPVIYDGYEFHISCSIGIAMYPTDGEDTETLLKNADTAMYRVKDRGSRFQFYTKSMNEKAHEKIIFENDLYRALERDEFMIYYQPQIHVKTGKVVGAEALLRWNHPKWGLVSPAQFIPLAEETGLIIPIGEWVMRTACTQMVEWNSGRISEPLTIAVNLSSRQFIKHDLVSTVKRVLQETNCDPQLVELEITESMAMDVGHAMTTLKELKDLGVKIGMDDFGTGYSSLSYLKKLPIDKLKIDQSFLRELEIDKNDAAIVATIISMAHNLNLKVNAEGVETGNQYKFLIQHRCDEAQGYFFSKPIPANEFAARYLKK